MTGLLLNEKGAYTYLGLGRDRFRKLVKAGVIPQWKNPLGGWPMYSKPALDEWAKSLGGES
jgi:hypothetical protein